jgi:hypothetical protein
MGMEMKDSASKLNLRTAYKFQNPGNYIGGKEKKIGCWASYYLTNSGQYTKFQSNLQNVKLN